VREKRGREGEEREEREREERYIQKKRSCKKGEKKGRGKA
jgi:hypothetical protein